MPRSADEEDRSQQLDRVLYLVATVHLDTQWRWTVRDTIARFLPETLRRNFELFDRYPSYVLSFEGAFRYMLAREHYPREYEELRRRGAAGRWHVAGCMLDAPDVNVPSPESLIRHVLYGKRFFDHELGGHGRDVFLPDCFGFSWALPSVAAHCGLIGFSSSKLVRWMAPAEAPFDIGWWRGPDGARILAAINPDGYGERLEADPRREPLWRERVESAGRASGVFAAFRYFGIGDRGGAPDEESLEHLEASQRGDGPLKVIHDGSDRVFHDLAAHPHAAALPLHDGELLLPTHGTGCLTSQAVLKRWNRKNELLADAAERAALAADWLDAAPYPRRELTDAWLRFLWHQMHDDLTGTSIPAAYRITANDEVVALNQFARVLTDSVGGVARALDTRVEGVPLVVFNPLAREREDVVEARVRWPAGMVSPEGAAAVRVLDTEGSAVPSQILASDETGATLLFLARLPAVGFRVFDVRPAAADFVANPEEAPSATTGSGFNGLENQLYRVRIDADGNVAELFDKRLDRELLAAPATLELLRDRSHRWPAWEMHYDEVRAPARERFAAPAEVRVLEAGPVRAALEIRRRVAGSTLVQTLRLVRGGDILEIDNRLDWRSRNRMLKAAFPLGASSPKVTYDLGLGAIERGNNRREKYEVPAQQWADLTDAAGAFGVSVLNDCKYGWDKPADHVLRLTLARSPGVFRKFVHQATQDHGPHRFTYALYGHAGGWAEGGTAERAARLNQPPLAFQTAAEAGPLGRELSLLAVESDGVAVRALKRVEEPGDEAWVVRLQETGGRPRAEVRLAAAAPLTEARPVDGCEEPFGETAAAAESGRPANGEVPAPGGGTAPSAGGENLPVAGDASPGAGEDVQLDGGALVTTLGAFQPRAFALRPAAPRVTVERPRFRPLRLERDRPAASFHGGDPVAFDDRGRSFPGELLPALLATAGIELHLADAPRGHPATGAPAPGHETAVPAAHSEPRARLEPDAPHCLSCRGQRLELAAGFDEVAIVATAVGGDAAVELEVGDSAVALTVGDWRAPLGQWVRRRSFLGIPLGRRPPYARRRDIAWLATHLHDRRVGDLPYQFGYLFLYTLPTPPGASFLRLPADERVRVFAVTQTAGSNFGARPAQPLFD